MILYFIFIFFSFHCYFSFGIVPPANELKALNEIVQKFNLSIGNEPNPDYCSYFTCDKTNGSIINSFVLLANSIEYTPIGAKIAVSDLEPFTGVTSIFLRGFEIEYEFIYHKFPNCETLFISQVRESIVINKTLPDYYSLDFDCKQLEGTEFKLSYISSKTTTFSIYGGNVNFIADVPKPTTLQNLRLKTKNIPDFKKFVFLILIINIDKDFNITSLAYYNTIGAKSISLLNDDGNNGPNLPSEFLSDRLVSNDNIYRDNFDVNGFLAPTNNEQIDLTKLNYSTLDIRKAGLLFNIQQNSKNVFPIKTENNTIYLKFNNGNISQIHPLSQFGRASYISVVNSNIAGDLGPYEPNNGLISRLYDFTNNFITGTIDPSWCNSLLIVKNNRMNGTIPSCFTCYFNFPIMAVDNPSASTFYEAFQGNNFDNLNLNIKCTTFAPQIERIQDKVLHIFGNDIGYDSTFYRIDDIGICSSYKAIEFGKSYECLTNSYSLKNLKYIKFNFKYPFDKDYYFPLIKRSPIISYVNFLNNNLQVNGSYFSSYLGHVSQIITISNLIFEILDSSDFFTIQATPIQTIPIQKLENLENTNTFDLLTLNTNSKTTRVYINSSSINDKICKNDCTDNDHGICNLYLGICVCLNDFIGEDCSITNFFITSVQPSTTNGGEAIFFGSFLDSTNNISLTIGGVDCQITFNSIGTIKCIAQPGNGIKTVILKQNNKIFTGVGIYKYIELSIPCPNKCSNNGFCNSTTGICKCNNRYTLYDCSALINIDNGLGGNNNNNNGGGGTNTTIDPGTGSTNITDSQTHFQIYLKSLIEVDINNNEVKSYSLLKNWVFNKTENEIEPNKYILKQQLINNTSPNSNGCIITSTIEEIKDKNGKEFTFAGTSFIVSSGSIKFTISITNYTYQSNLNTLKLELMSSVDKIDKINNCNSKDTEIDTTNVNDISTFNYIKISKNNKIFSGRFINKVLSDGRSTFFTTSARNDSNSIIVSLNLPHCINECLIDPDFSVLISNDFKSECDDDSSRKWLLPVVIIIPILGAALLFIVFFILYKKSTTLKIMFHATKLKKLNNNK
ncbi:hypothetical protein ACTFIY_008670 [Dictyostelium cf. discoideum]